jgi:hypothetical protein
MVDLQHSTANESSNNGYKNKHDLGILHHNIQSLENKVMALNVLLGSWMSRPAVLFFSEHWLNKLHLLHINIYYYKLAANFCRISNRYGGTCIYVLNDIKTRELTFIQNLAREGVFEISATEIVDWKIIIVCIYRSPSSSRESFLQLLEETLNNIKKRGISWCYVETGT